MQTELKPVFLEKIINDEQCVTHFHPIISIIRKSVVGLEALTRGLDPSSGGLISPARLFEAAARQNLTVSLDRLCREKAIQTFAQARGEHDDTLLFLNFDTSIIDKGVVGSGHLINCVRENNLAPERVVLEIVESKVNDTAALQRFVSTYKEYGFLVALDDVGAGYSNFDRIPLIKPDILKVDRGIISGIHQNYYRQEIFKALVNLARKIGALVVAEGVETAAESVRVLELGADMLQGFHFGQPKPPGTEENGFNRVVKEVASEFRSAMIRKFAQEDNRRARAFEVAAKIADDLARCPAGGFNGCLKTLIFDYPAVESMYVLDTDGIQVSETISRLGPNPSGKNSIFSGALKGTDHSLKHYFLLLRGGEPRCITEPYISLASGNLCMTVSTEFEHFSQSRYILCVDFTGMGAASLCV